MLLPTTTKPVMLEWMLQWYVYVPAVAKVRDTAALLVGPGMSAGAPLIESNVTV